MPSLGQARVFTAVRHVLNAFMQTSLRGVIIKSNLTAPDCLNYALFYRSPKTVKIEDECQAILTSYNHR